jgi:putative ABC transport system permease protein
LKLHTLLFKELQHRRLNALISVLSIVLALTSIIAAMETMHRFDRDTEQQLDALTAETDATMRQLNDQIRKTMKGLGFNIHIYPAEQNLADVYANGFASSTMPQDTVNKLADSPIVTINHLLPQLSRRMLWQEKNAEIMLIGVDGQVPIAHRNPTKPIMQPVQSGTAVIGSELATNHSLKVGDAIFLNGTALTINKVHPARGNIDDITIWIPLDTVQAMLNLPNQISSILALGCNCASIDRLGEIRAELSKIIPNTQIIEVESKALARAETRNQVKVDSEKTRQDILNARNASRAERQQFLSILTPLILLGSLVGLFTLCLFNVRERRAEIGTLLSIGVPTSKLFGLFLGRAVLLGAAGAALAAIICIGVGYPPSHYWHLLLLAPFLTLLSAWLPTLAALSEDPVTILKQN